MTGLEITWEWRSRWLHSMTDKGWVRWLAAIGWTGFVLYYLLQQPGTPAVEIVAPVAAPDWKREVVFTIGHITGFGMMFFLWYVALVNRYPDRAMITAFLIAMSVGLVAEYLQQRLPDRTASLYDVMMNTLGIGAVALVIRRRKNPLS